MSHSILDLTEDKRKSAETRFWAKVEKSESCWNWTACTAKGYGIFAICATHWKAIYAVAHRVSYELLKGRIPNGKQLDHLCRNHSCVNPNHLEIVSNRENVLRGIGVTAMHSRQTHCVKGHALNEGNLVRNKLKKGFRVCLTCKMGWDRLWRMKQKQLLEKR